MTNITKTIFNQFGGNRAMLMIGGTDVVNDLMNTINFKFKAKAKNKANIFQVKYNAGTDLYDCAFFRYHDAELTTIEKLEGIDAENLKSIFENSTGLYLSL